MRKKVFSFLEDLTCTTCKQSYSADQIQTFCTECNAPLLANYHLDTLRGKLDRDELSYRQKGMWRWSELLPVNEQSNIVSLGEGDTPLIHLRNIGKALGLTDLYIKEEGMNPTGSFKARGLSVAVSKAKELSIKKIVLPSAGNAGGALAAYAASAGINTRIYMPKSSPTANIIEARMTGAEVNLVNGTITEAGKFAQEIADQEGWFNMATFKEPYRVEGKKIMGYEIAERFSWKLPDVIIYPTGGGTGLVGMWKAFMEIEALGWLASDNRPKMVSVQASGCAPIVKAFESSKSASDCWEDAHTVATGLCVPHSFADKIILKYLRDSNGAAISVTDDEILIARQLLGREEGIFSCPEGAATLAALTKLIEQGLINREEKIILFNTGSGLKYIC